MEWDSSRVSAAIPSGIGFLGSGLIWKGKDAKQVGGLVTAASAWLSAAVGVSCGGGLYFVAIFTTLCTMVVLKYGARVVTGGVDEEEEPEPDPEQEQMMQEQGHPSTYGSLTGSLQEPLLKGKGLRNRPLTGGLHKRAVTRTDSAFFLSKDT